MTFPRTSAESSRFKILVVDDHPNTATTLARAITQIGSRVEVHSATSGNEALEILKDGATDILITDMIMPEMTGLELIEHLQHQPAARPAFCFLMTAYDVPGLEVTARRLHVRDLIVKPVHPERICLIINQLIDELDQAKLTWSKPAPRNAFKILIADDQPDNQILLSRFLADEGYEYIKATDGLETLEKVRSELPDMVLLDVNMPRMDGFAVLKEIRSDPITQHIPVIILTAARLNPADIQSGLNMGADDYVTKPFDRQELLARIRTKLRVKAAEDAIRRRNRELNLLPEIGKQLSARLDLEDLATVLLRNTVETLGAMVGHIVIVHSGGFYHKTYRLDSDPSPFTLSDGLLEFIQETRQGFIVGDIQIDPKWQSSMTEDNHSAVVVPMLGRHSLLGMLVLTNEQTNYFTHEHLLLLQAITSQASIAVENAQLYDKVAQEQQRLAAVLQNAADAILMFDANGCLRLVNPAGQKLFTDYHVRIGQPLPPESGYDAFLKLLDQTGHSKAPFSGEIAWAGKRVFSASMTPVREGGVVVVLHDVTRFKELERVKDEFTATASHDLRNPITAIYGYTMLIKQAGPLNDSQQEFTERIQNAAKNIEELVENMLDLATMDLGAKKNFDLLNLSPLIWEMADEFQVQADAKRQLLAVGPTERYSMVEADALKIRQALRNLIGNAIKYTPQGGVIMVSLAHKTGMANVKIQDTGYGIPRDDLPYVFDRFYRVRDNGHAEVKGNGLGLAIVKSIAHEHRGTVSVESEVGKGSSFTLAIPLISNADFSTFQPDHPQSVTSKQVSQ